MSIANGSEELALAVKCVLNVLAVILVHIPCLWH